MTTPCNAGVCERLASNDPDRLEVNAISGLRTAFVPFPFPSGHLGQADFDRLTAAVAANPHVRALNFNMTIREGCGSLIVPFLDEVLPAHPSLVSLSLFRDYLTDTHAGLLAKILKKRTPLAMLYIGENCIGPEGARALSEALLHNETLEELNLSHNQIGDGGATALGSALENNRRCRLKLCYLSECGIGGDGAKALAACKE